MPKVDNAVIQEWVVDQWVKDPSISLTGRNGMQGRLMEVFGKVLRTKQLIRLRDEAKRKGEKEMAAKAKPKAAFNPVLKPDQANVVSLRARPSSGEPTADSSTAGPPSPTGPGTGTSREDALVRRKYARKALIADPAARNTELMADIAKRYGRNVSQTTLAEVRKELGIVKHSQHVTLVAPHGKSRVPKRRSTVNSRSVTSKVKAKPATRTKPPKRTPPKRTPPKRTAARSKPANPNEAIRTAIQMLMEEVPELSTLEVSRTDGETSVKYELAVQTVQAGELSL